jgi:nucleoid DNA-binding protein
MTATKSDLVKAVAEANGFPRNKSAELIEVLIDLIKSKLVAGVDMLTTTSGSKAGRNNHD